MPDESDERAALAQKTRKLLEFDEILQRLAQGSMSEEAAAIIREEIPCADPLAVEKTKELVKAAMALIGEGGEPRRSLPSIGFLLPKLGVEGASLELDEACAIGLFAERGEELRKWLSQNPLFQETLGAPPDCAPVATAVFKVIDKEGNMRDLPELRAIKQRIRGLKTALDSAVSRYAARDEVRHMLQSAVPSQRDGRIVLAVRANFRGRIRGIVHEVSASGQTIFVEPEEAIEKNNDIIIETKNLAAEIRKILLNLTCAISERRFDLKAFHLAIIAAEIILTKARYSLETSANFAISGDDAKVSLSQARHPLLRTAVPIDLTMKKGSIDGADARALIITGPNTGGKTVTLKTLGLLAMMNQIGLAIPAAEGSALPVFDGIFADIGDEQSIGQSLSTFSAHIANIAGIIKHCASRSLALLDELGSGTDPQEGCAIAMAVLDCLIEKRATLLVTTHHGILKNYGYTRAEVENASVEFNSDTLSPTYRIITGIPGESRALEIAERNGLARGIVARARLYIDEGHSDVSALIGGLKDKHRELDALGAQARLEEAHLHEERRKSDLKELRLKQKELELKAGFAGGARLLLDESRKTLENLVRELREGEITREKTLKVNEFLKNLALAAEAESALVDEERRSLATQTQRLKRETARSPGDCAAANGAPPFAPGMEVFAGEARRRGTIARKDKKSAGGTTWIVEIGSLKISLPESELEPAAPSPPPRAQISGVDYASSPTARAELRLLGMRMDEAREALRRQIDAAALCGLKTFGVIHGKGEGILQKGVHEMLKNDPAVEDYFFAHPELGGFGRTEVVLR
ncbi:MAG: Smr/MutS family protein [Treponema sp.]|nr:Smr/MutS family protein [Treponema sp.]